MTRLYLTAANADSGVTAGSGTKWKAGWAPGASATHLNKNTVAGPTAPLQMTDGATAGTDGTAVSWYTEPLWAVTIAGQISCLFWTRENATNNNTAPTIRIERCSGDGTVLSTIVSETTSHGAGEMATTAGGASDAMTLTAANVTDTTLADGDRLRITLWIDDASGQGGTGSMGSGGRGEFWINGPNGAQGQSELSFTELVIPQAGPRLLATPETSFTTTTTPKTLTATGAQTDDLLVALMGGDNFSTPTSAASTSTTGGTTGAWTEVLEALVGNTDSAWKSNAWADVTGNGDVTVSLARTQSSPQVWGGWLAHFREHGGIGNTAELVDSSADSVSLTVSEGSMVLALGIEWDHLALTEFVPAGAHDVEHNAGLTSVSWYAGLWVGQAAGTRNYGIATNGSNNFSWTVIEVLAPPSGTPVGKDLALVWHTRAAVGDAVQAIWHTRALVADELSLVWHDRSLVSDDLSLVWHTRQAVGDDLALVWHVRQAIGDDLSLLWDVASSITAVGKDLALVWHTRQTLADDLALSWHVRQAVSDTLALEWHVRQAISDSLELIWHTRNLVSDDLSLIWHTRATVGDVLSLLWHTRAPVGDDLSLVWDVEVIGLSAVGKDLALRWHTRQAVGDDLSLLWHTRQAIADELALVWHTRSLAGQTLSLPWAVRTTVGEDIVLAWAVRTAAGDDLVLVWHIRQAVADDLVLVWSFEGAGTVIRVLQTRVMERWATRVDQRWKTRVIDRWP